MPNISVAAEKIASLYGFPITNSLLTTWIVMGILFIFTFFATRKMSMVPQGVQLIAEMVIGSLHDFFKSVVGKYLDAFFPLIASIFLFVIVANWIGLLPGVGTIGFFETKKEVITQTSETETSESKTVTQSEKTVPPVEKKEFVPLLRGATADINTTLALALVTVFCIQYFGFKFSGIHYAKKFIDISNPINFFIGILEILSEISRIISFAFRLFGNIFAGEVLLTVMAFLMPFIAPLPFLSLELFVGFIQALVFSLLAAVFLYMAVTHGEHESHAAAHN
jgi:F-type H+-transporting ATPase subunit a